MKLLKVNKSRGGDWLQISHPTKSTHEIILRVSPKVSIPAMRSVPKHAPVCVYSPMPNGNIYKYTLTQKPPAS